MVTPRQRVVPREGGGVSDQDAIAKAELALLGEREHRAHAVVEALQHVRPRDDQPRRGERDALRRCEAVIGDEMHHRIEAGCADVERLAGARSQVPDRSRPARPALARRCDSRCGRDLATG
jgi:hypothetical protein